jgi:predicted MPP superfamily phosphohydrolase
MTTQKRRFTRRDFLKLTTYFALSIAAVEAGSFYASSVEPSWFEVTQLRLKLPRLPAAFSGFRLAQISDLHFGGWMTLEKFKPALDLLYAQNPDAIAITGDFIEALPRQWDMVQDAFHKLAQRYPTFAVLGNHDYWTDAAMVRRFLKATGIRELSNDIYPLEKAGQKLYMCGVDDIWERKNDLRAVTDKLSMQDCAILMAHEPDFADQSATSGLFDLQISGHSHGGQISIPFFGPPLLPWLGRKYHTGLYQVGEMIQYTNRGLGMIRPPIRFNCRPEITIFTLV